MKNIFKTKDLCQNIQQFDWNNFTFPRISKSLFAIFALTIISCSDDDGKNEETFPVFGTCEAVALKGRLTVQIVNEKKMYKYTTIGGGEISINFDGAGGIFFGHSDYPNFTYESWGDTSTITSANHENLNGKHLKDRIGNVRSFIFPDGAKMTYIAQGQTEPLTSLRIYDQNAVFHINATCNTVEYSSTNSKFARQLDEEEPDGETSTFEITETGLLVYNLYFENVAGTKIPAEYPLGSLVLSNPTLVNDLYDDPRLAHTRLSNVNTTNKSNQKRP